MVFKRPSRSLEGEKGEFNSHRKTKVFRTVGSQGGGGLKIFGSWSPYSADSYDLDLSVVFHDKYQWEIWENTAGKSAKALYEDGADNVQVKSVIICELFKSFQITCLP